MDREQQVQRRSSLENRSYNSPYSMVIFNHYFKNLSTLIFRLRSGHAPTPSHLHRLGVRDSPFCVCGSENIGDIDHIYLNCNRYKNKIGKCYANITNEKIVLPTRMTILLHYTNVKSDISKIIIKHIYSIGWFWNNTWHFTSFHMNL